MADVYWRYQNLQTERFTQPLHVKRERQSRAFINELAFESFVRVAVAENKGNREKFRVAAESSKDSVAEYIACFSDLDKSYFLKEFSSEVSEVVLIAERLYQYFFPKFLESDKTLRPKFYGCGVLMAAEGDVLLGETLFEVKAGDRNFRVADLRQLLVYCALNRQRPVASITEVALVNPRVGVSWSSDLESCSRAISGISSTELLDQIADFVVQPRTYE